MRPYHPSGVPACKHSTNFLLRLPKTLELPVLKAGLVPLDYEVDHLQYRVGSGEGVVPELGGPLDLLDQPFQQVSAFDQWTQELGVIE